MDDERFYCHAEYKKENPKTLLCCINILNAFKRVSRVLFCVISFAAEFYFTSTVKRDQWLRNVFISMAAANFAVPRRFAATAPGRTTQLIRKRRPRAAPNPTDGGNFEKEKQGGEVLDRDVTRRADDAPGSSVKSDAAAPVKSPPAKQSPFAAVSRPGTRPPGSSQSQKVRR